MSGYVWKPIQPLSEEEKRSGTAMRPLYESWREAKKRLQESSPSHLADFNRRLVRRLSIETGILERLYDLDRGTTEALVTHGFAEDLVSHSSTNIEPSRLIDILRDQEAAIQLVMDCVAKSRDLTKGMLHELQAILTRHQDTTTAVDQFGNRLEIRLLKGKFKEQPNNPQRQDGTLHEYCPPIQVASEIDNLLGWLPQYANDDPVIVAAWLHHRFTQIHPYQDGNGRVARALATLILLRNDLLPVVVDRNLRTGYIAALERADQGELSALAELFAHIEQTAVLQALSLDVDAQISQQPNLTSAVLENLAAKLKKRKLQQSELRQVNSVALGLRARAKIVLEQSFIEMASTLRAVGEPSHKVEEGGPDKHNYHPIWHEIVKSAKDAGKFVNLAEDHYFIKGSMLVNREHLAFVVSLHHVGRELTGIMEATASSKLESREDMEGLESLAARYSLCSVEPFVFAHTTKLDDIADSFDRWLDAAVALAVKEYGDRL